MLQIDVKNHYHCHRRKTGTYMNLSYVFAQIYRLTQKMKSKTYFQNGQYLRTSPVPLFSHESIRLWLFYADNTPNNNKKKLIYFRQYFIASTDVAIFRHQVITKAVCRRSSFFVADFANCILAHRQSRSALKIKKGYFTINFEILLPGIFAR